MAEYIEREALLDEINIAPVSMSICMNVDECKGRIYERERLVRIINAATAADVAPVVRCKDCKHYNDGWCHRVHNPAQYSKIPDDWFCADGEYLTNCGAQMED